MVTEYNERGKFFTNIITKDPVHVLIQTANQRIEGEVHMRRDERLREEINQPERFLAITNAIIFDAIGTELYRTNLLMINSSQIIWLTPFSEMNTGQVENE